MDFLTIHQLSREFDLPARVVRYRLLNFLQAGKLHEGEDFRREDYKDDRHFIWKVNPLTFMRESGLKPKTLPPDPLPVVNEALSTANQVDNNNRKLVNEFPGSVNHPPQSNAAIDNKPPAEELRADLEREIIDFLKDQIAVKDRQLFEQANQYKEINELNEKLMGATLRQSEKIEELLRLVGEQGSENSHPTTSVNDTASVVHNAVNNLDNDGEAVVNEPPEEE